MADLYELINPSDAHTFYAANDQVAHVVAAVLHGMYFAKRCDDKPMEPAPSDMQVFYDSHRAEAADALATMVVGTGCTGSRNLYEKTLARIPEAQRAAWLAEWEDAKRSSMARIQQRAHQLARSIKDSLAEPAKK